MLFFFSSNKVTIVVLVANGIIIKWFVQALLNI